MYIIEIAMLKVGARFVTHTHRTHVRHTHTHLHTTAASMHVVIIKRVSAYGALFCEYEHV